MFAYDESQDQSIDHDRRGQIRDPLNDDSRCVNDVYDLELYCVYLYGRRLCFHKKMKKFWKLSECEVSALRFWNFI